MARKSIEVNVKRRIIAESMGRCMNPDCREKLFIGDGDIMEKAHIEAYCETLDNDYDNLIILCPNCHTKFDKNKAFTAEQAKSWKRIRQEEVRKFFEKKYSDFLELKNVVKPLLLENQAIYENYYINDEKELWDAFENRILINNRKIKGILENNMHLIQYNENGTYSNQKYVQRLLFHIEEFEGTRNENNNRRVLFPKEINSIFGIEPVNDYFLPMTESLEDLISKLKKEGNFETVCLGIEKPYLKYKENGKSEIVYLDDAPNLRQMYYNYNSFKKVGVRLNSLNYALKYMRGRNVLFKFLKEDNLREIMAKEKHMIFVYKYCLSKKDIYELALEEDAVVVNLHNWNGEGCISEEAYTLANTMKIKLLTMDKFYEYVNKM